MKKMENDPLPTIKHRSESGKSGKHTLFASFSSVTGRTGAFESEEFVIGTSSSVRAWKLSTIFDSCVQKKEEVERVELKVGFGFRRMNISNLIEFMICTIAMSSRDPTADWLQVTY